jgi:hypothetical protein
MRLTVQDSRFGSQAVALARGTTRSKDRTVSVHDREIIKHGRRSFADVTKVHSLTSLLEEQETITDLE